MSQYGTEYRLQFATMPVQDATGERIATQNITCSIFDTENLIGDSDTPVVIPLRASGNPLHISTINNDVDKFQPIRAKQAVIEFLTDSPSFQTASTFADSSDNRWYVKIVDGSSNILFLGFVILADVQQSFQPDPVPVKLTCNDHLGILKDIPWSLDDESNPSGKFRIAEIIALCLKKTGLSLDIIAINNLRHGSGKFAISCTLTSPHTISGFTDTSLFYVGQKLIISGTPTSDQTTTVTSITSTTVDVAGTLNTEFAPATVFTDYSSTLHFYDGIYIDAKTFEDQISTCIDCYSVLSQVFGEDCFIEQYLGKWYIYRVDEFDNNNTYPAQFDKDGNFTSFLAHTTYSKNIGSAEDTKLANADALERFDRPHRFVKETFSYRTPLENPCNSDYSRGNVTLDADVQLTGYTAYNLDCWDIWKEWGASRVAADVKAAIHRSFNNLGDEITRYFMMTGAPSLGATRYLLSSAIPVGVRDRFTFTFDVAAIDSPAGAGALPICTILLYGSDGTVWVLCNNDLSITWDTTINNVQTQWKQTDADFSLFRRFFWWTIYDSANNPVKTDWQSCEMIAADMPVDGEIRIHLLCASTQSDSFDDFRIKYQNLRFDYRAYIGGSYQKYTGQYNQVTRSPFAGYFANRQKDIFISDSPKALFKGAMFWYDGSNYHLTNRFYTGNTVYSADPPSDVGTVPDSTYLHPYGHIQSYAVWNQYRNANRIFEGSVLGLGTSWADLIHKIVITDTNPNTNNRYFMLISYDQDWKKGMWKGTFVEAFRTDLGHVYTDTHLLKYITE